MLTVHLYPLLYLLNKLVNISVSLGSTGHITNQLNLRKGLSELLIYSYWSEANVVSWACAWCPKCVCMAGCGGRRPRDGN